MVDVIETDPELQAAQEQQLIETARDAVNQSAWIVGRCAASWIRRYAAAAIAKAKGGQT